MKKVARTRRLVCHAKTKVLNQKEKTTSQLREELNLKTIHTEINPEPNVVYQIVNETEESKERLGLNDGITSNESQKNLDREGLQRQKTLISIFNDEFRVISLAMTTIADQNQILLEIIKSVMASRRKQLNPPT